MIVMFALERKISMYRCIYDRLAYSERFDRYQWRTQAFITINGVTDNKMMSDVVERLSVLDRFHKHTSRFQLSYLICFLLGDHSIPFWNILLNSCKNFSGVVFASRLSYIGEEESKISHKISTNIWTKGRSINYVSQ